MIGPDPGVRFDYRIGRFVKSYLRCVAWNDKYYYLQAQGYWVLANWALFARTGEATYRDIAVRCSRQMLSRQREDGAWEYPNPEWKGRVATNEGTWASLGLLETYRHSMYKAFLQGVLNWHKYLTEVTGFQALGDELAINYFAKRGGGRVPNNSITVLRFFAELADATGDKSYMAPSVGLMNFIRRVQRPSGEFPYSIRRIDHEPTKAHFQCYQYNAFECLNLIRYLQVTGDETVSPVVARLLGFLRHGLAQEGYAFYDCHERSRTVTYHTAALGAAFSQAGRFGFEGYDNLAERAFSHVLKSQRRDGGFIHSRRDYCFLTDRRSYPRYLAMILYHLLHSQAGLENEPGLDMPAAFLVGSEQRVDIPCAS